MEERVAYLVISLESIFRKCHVTKFMTACKNHLYPQLNLQLMPGQKKNAIYACTDVSYFKQMCRNGSTERLFKTSKFNQNIPSQFGDMKNMLSEFPQRVIHRRASIRLLWVSYMKILDLFSLMRELLLILDVGKGHFI